MGAVLYQYITLAVHQMEAIGNCAEYAPFGIKGCAPCAWFVRMKVVGACREFDGVDRIGTAIQQHLAVWCHISLGIGAEAELGGINLSGGKGESRQNHSGGC